jgi:hypothetical protein
MTTTKKNFLLVACVSAVVVPGMWLFFIWDNRMPTMPPKEPCRANLRQIHGAILTWQLENQKSTNDVVLWTHLVGLDLYLREMPKCPGGGTYMITRVGDLPSCSISEHTDYFRKSQ